MLEKSTTDEMLVSDVAQVWAAVRRRVNNVASKRKRPTSAGSSSTSSKRLHKRRSAQQSTSAPDPTGADASPPAMTDSSNSTPGSTARLGLFPMSSSNGSPKIKKRDHVKRVFRKFQRKTSSGSLSSSGHSDTSIEGNSPRRLRTSFVPEVTVTPSSDNSDAASPAASVRTMYRVNPHTGKPAARYDTAHLIPPAAAHSRRKMRKRAEAAPKAFPKRSSSLRASLDYPFDPENAVEQNDESHLYSSKPSSPTTGTAPAESPESLVASSFKSVKSTISKSSLDKPLPALPANQRSSVLDLYASPTRVVAPDTPTKPSRTFTPTNKCLFDLPASFAEDDIDDDDTPRPIAWPLPAKRQSIYGSGGDTTTVSSRAAFALGISDDEDEENDSALDDSPTHARSQSGSSELSKYGFRFYKPLDPRVMDARLRQYHRAHPSPPVTPKKNTTPTTTITPEDFPAVPKYVMTPPTEMVLRALQNRASVASTTAESFVTATEEVRGEEGGAEDPFAELGAAFGDGPGRVFDVADDDDDDDDNVAVDETGDDVFKDFEDSGIAMSDDDTPAASAEVAKHAAASITTLIEHSEEPETVGPLDVSTSAPPELSSELFKDKMAWEYDPWTFDYDAQWKVEPSIDSIKQIAQKHYKICGLPNADISVEFLAEGTYNKVYTVTSIDQDTGTVHECIFRCSLPVSPWFKTQSEVTTMEYVRTNTSIPVPKVFVFDPSMDNPIGLEWILMEKIHGKMYEDVADTLSFSAKAQLYRTVAEWVDQLSRLRFDQIGALYRNWKRPASAARSYKLGPLHTCDFTSDLRLDYRIYRGPYSSYWQYYNAYTLLSLSEALDPRHKARVEAWNAQEAAEEAGEPVPDPPVPETRFTLEALARMPLMCIELQSVLPIALDGKELGAGSTRLHHHDISERNIMVDDAGKPLALIDWELSWVTAPGSIDRYPPLILEEEVAEPKPLGAGEVKDERRVREERAWEEVLLKREFDERLAELGSPHLEAGRDKDERLAEVNRLVGALDSLSDMSFIERMREELLSRYVD